MWSQTTSAKATRTGPTLSWRGFCRRLYYEQQNESKRYQASPVAAYTIAGTTGRWCGVLIIGRCAAAWSWASMASASIWHRPLPRREHAARWIKPPLFEEIEADPELSDLKW